MVSVPYVRARSATTHQSTGLIGSPCGNPARPKASAAGVMPLRVFTIRRWPAMVFRTHETNDGGAPMRVSPTSSAWSGTTSYALVASSSAMWHSLPRARLSAMTEATISIGVEVHPFRTKAYWHPWSSLCFSITSSKRSETRAMQAL